MTALRSALLALSAAATLLLGPLSPAQAATWPVDPGPQVVQPFDPPASQWGAGHRGVDLSGRHGQVVRAALGGQVTFAGVIAGKGVVTVDHGTVRTTYEPVTATMRRGQAVHEGQALGRLRVWGSHCFPRACLHWGALRGDVYLDPLSLVGAGPVRLKPLVSPPAQLSRLGWLALTLGGVPGGMPPSTAHW